MKRPFWTILLILIVFALGFIAARSYYMPRPGNPREEATVIVDKIEKVCKLVTVEGHFVEYFDYEDPDPGPMFSYPYLLNPLALLPKRTAQLRVKGKVLVGYDLKDIQIDALPEQKVIRISQVPDPDILALEHDIQYFDKVDNIFYRFSDEEIVNMTKGAERKLREAALGSSLIQAAKEQGNDLFELIEFMVVNAGWSLEIIGEETVPEEQKDSLWNDLQ